VWCGFHDTQPGFSSENRVVLFPQFNILQQLLCCDSQEFQREIGQSKVGQFFMQHQALIA
jgi:hypothetical protein